LINHAFVFVMCKKFLLHFIFHRSIYRGGTKS
jgi:hypothetical protein